VTADHKRDGVSGFPIGAVDRLLNQYGQVGSALYSGRFFLLSPRTGFPGDSL
jgi:hypothetical protein